MSDLLTSLDVVNQAFKKIMRGYDPSEVDEFLDKVAECIQVYVQKIKDYERVIEEQTERLGDYENIKGSLHEALLMAQHTADEKVANANLLADEKITEADRISQEKIALAAATAENILGDAKNKAERMVREAEASMIDFGRELTLLKELRNSGFADMYAFINEIKSVLDRAESAGRIQVPAMTQNLMNRSGVYQEAETGASESFAAARHMAEADDYADSAPRSSVLTPEQRQEQFTNTLNVLGIDLSLLDTNPGAGLEKP